MRCSVVIATFNKGWALAKTLEAVRRQETPFDYEIIVVNDGSTDDTEAVCEEYGVEYIYLDRPYVCGPAAAMNAGYKRAKGDIIVCLNDDVMMQGTDCLEKLCQLPKREYHVGGWWSLDEDGVLDKEQIAINDAVPDGCVAKPSARRTFWKETRIPIFFMTAVWRRDVYGVGGRDEDFTKLNCEDVWFMECLVKGRGLKPVFRDDCEGWHQWHERPDEHWCGKPFEDMSALWRGKRAEAEASGEWFSSGGPWAYEEK